MPSPSSRRWVVLRETDSTRWGGDLRRFRILARLGANGRRAAERDFDWRILGERVADIVLERVGGER
jgi:hypothetical protein